MPRHDLNSGLGIGLNRIEMEITEMDIQEAYRALSLMHSSPHRRDDEFYRLAGEWLRLRNVNATDKKKYHAKLEKWHDDVIEYLVEMHLEAIERGLVRDPLAFLKKQKNPQGMFAKITNYFRPPRRSSIV
jgi:hypothetical protein